MKPERIRLSRKGGWRKPEDTVVVARPSLWGNPFPIEVYGDAQAIDLHRRWLVGDMSAADSAQLARSDRWSDPARQVSLWALRSRVIESLPVLRGKNLACWCRLEGPCHADVLLALANR